MDDKELLDEIPRIVTECYVEQKLIELIEQQKELTQEINEFKSYMNKHVDSLDRRLLEINKTITNASAGVQDLKTITIQGGTLN